MDHIISYRLRAVVPAEVDCQWRCASSNGMKNLQKFTYSPSSFEI
jgi:hypothetical protein